MAAASSHQIITSLHACLMLHIHQRMWGSLEFLFYVFLSLILRVNYQLVNSNRLHFKNIFLGSERTISVC